MTRKVAPKVRRPLKVQHVRRTVCAHGVYVGEGAVDRCLRCEQEQRSTQQ